jgi:hypothetical protein
MFDPLFKYMIEYANYEELDQASIQD